MPRPQPQGYGWGTPRGGNKLARSSHRPGLSGLHPPGAGCSDRYGRGVRRLARARAGLCAPGRGANYFGAPRAPDAAPSCRRAPGYELHGLIGVAGTATRRRRGAAPDQEAGGSPGRASRHQRCVASQWRMSVVHVRAPGGRVTGVVCMCPAGLGCLGPPAGTGAPPRSRPLSNAQHTCAIAAAGWGLPCWRLHMQLLQSAGSAPGHGALASGQRAVVVRACRPALRRRALAVQAAASYNWFACPLTMTAGAQRGRVCLRPGKHAEIVCRARAGLCAAALDTPPPPKRPRERDSEKGQ